MFCPTGPAVDDRGACLRRPPRSDAWHSRGTGPPYPGTLSNLDRDIGAGTYAVTYLAAGEREKVREWLEVAVTKIERNEPDAGTSDLFNMRSNIYRHPLLEEPEFRELRARLGRL